MGVRNNAAGALRWQGLGFGVFWTFILFLIGVLCIILGNANSKNTLDPKYEHVNLKRVGSERYCASGASEINCRKRDKRYKSTYSTSECSNFSKDSPYVLNSRSSGPDNISMERHKETRECRERKMSKMEASVLIFVGVLFLLASIGMGLCTYNETCRGFLGFYSMFSWLMPSSYNYNNY